MARRGAHISPGEERGGERSQASGIRRRPSQERAAVTVEAILQAASELFCRVGYDRASTNRIAERAGVSIGSLYQYFANKEAILAALLEEHQRAVHEVVDQAMMKIDNPEISLRVGLDTLFRSLVELHADDPELTRVLTEEVPNLAHGKSDADEVASYVRRTADGLRRRPEVRVGDLETAAILVVTTVDSLTRWMVHGTVPGLDRGPVIREAVAMLVSYLESGSSVPAGSDRVDG